MRFRVFPCDLEGSGCYRVVYPYGLIDAHTSHEVIMAAQMSEKRMLLPIPESMVGYGEQDVPGELEAELFLDSDVYVFQRPVEKLYPGVIMKLKVAGKKVVVELDDYMHGLSPIGPKTTMSKLKKRASTEALTLCVRMADLVTVSTQALKDEYSRMNANVVVLPNYLHPKDFEGISPSWSQDREKIRVGWMGLKTYRANDLSLVKPWLQRFLKRHPEVVFVNVGNQDALDYLCVPRGQRMNIPGSPFPGHFEPTSEIDIGLAPLTNNRFNECKSALKGMEYGAVGAMVIASPRHEYIEWVDNGFNGYLADSPQEWEAALEAALEDDLWRVLAESNWHKTREHLIQDHWGEWLTAHGLPVEHIAEFATC